MMEYYENYRYFDIDKIFINSDLKRRNSLTL